MPGDLETLHRLVLQIKLLFDRAQLTHKSVTLDIVGHSDSSGEESTNKPLSQSRADRVRSELTREGIARGDLRSRGVASTEPLRKEENEEARQYNRSVTFRITNVRGPGASSLSTAASAGSSAARP
jgi:outer membrane protein OmpA-like peptidoglycan-associated protein